jgi:hypothetical protein
MTRARTWRTETLLLLLPLLAAGGACDRAASEPAPQETAASAEATGGAAQPAVPLVRGGAGQEAAAGGPAAPAAGPGQGAGLDFELPAGWERQTPGTNMRLAQATIPGPGGPGEFAVFHFGAGDGGAVEPNLQRWADQMGGAAPQRESFEANGLQVTWIDLAGTLQPSGMGMGPSTPQPNSRLLGAVVEGPGGPWFFKATGPDATLGPQRDAFVRMLKSVRLRTQA